MGKNFSDIFPLDAEDAEVDEDLVAKAFEALAERKSEFPIEVSKALGILAAAADMEEEEEKDTEEIVDSETEVTPSEPTYKGLPEKLSMIRKYIGSLDKVMEILISNLEESETEKEEELVFVEIDMDGFASKSKGETVKLSEVLEALTPALNEVIEEGKKDDA